MDFELTEKAMMVDNRATDAIYVPEYRVWIPIPPKGSKIEVIISEDEGIKYRCIKVNGQEYPLHQFRYEYGRPQLLKGALKLAGELAR